ncbi:MAG: hypothetical protein ABI082_04715 [Dokdonella sp.]
MSQPRRRFLQQIALVCTALVLERAHAAPSQSKDTATKEDALGYATFAALVGREFNVTRETSNATLKLAEVVRPKSLRSYPNVAKSREKCFTLIFKGDADRRLPEGIYRVGAIGLASFDAFMSPVGNTGVGYQVVFNRI